MNKSRVAIVIVNWKTPDLLASCLESVLADSGSESFDIWVVDNASADESLSMLAARFPGVNVIANNENVGFARACNQAIARTNSRYILLLNPDTVVVSDAISAMASYLDRNRRCAAVGPKVLNTDGTLQLACRRAFPSPAAAFFRITYLSRIFPEHPLLGRYNMTFTDPDRELEVDALSGACMMVRTSFVERVGLLDEEIFMFGEDIDWCWRFKKAGGTINYFPGATVFHYHGASSRLRPVGATINLHKGMEVFYRKHLARRYPSVFNALVYASIWARAAVFIVLASMRLVFARREAAVMPTRQLRVLESPRVVLDGNDGDARASREPAAAAVPGVSSEQPGDSAGIDQAAAQASRDRTSPENEALLAGIARNRLVR